MEVKHLNLYLQGSTFHWASLLCIFIFSFFLSGSGYCQTIIRGSAPQYIGASISVLTYNNFITYSTRELTSTIIKEDGTFELTVNEPHAGTLILDVQFMQYSFYVTQGGEYEVLMERLPTMPDLPLWLMKKRPENDINLAIQAFDDSLIALSKDYYPYIVKGIKVQEVDSMLDALSDFSSGNGSAFMASHVRYKLALVKQITHKKKISEFEREFILNSPVKENHPAYMQFITQYFSKYLSILGAESNGNRLNDLINKENDLDGVFTLLKRDDRLVNDTLRELVLLNGLYELYYAPLYSRQMVLAMIKSIATSTRISAHVNLANDIISSLSKLKEGTKAPAFDLPDSEGEMVKLSDFEGKFVYLSFFTSTCSTCSEDLGILLGLFKKYGDEVAFVTVSLGKLQGNINNETEGKGPDKKSKMYFLSAKEDENIKADYNIRSVPNYILIDRAGNILKAPAIAPTGTIEQMLSNVIIGKKHKGSITDPEGN